MRGGGVCWDMTSTCVQGGLVRPLGAYQANVIMEPHSPAPAWNMHQSVVPKQEPIHEDVPNDSGITSGSDFHSSSPGSDNSHDYNQPAYACSPNVIAPLPAYYSSPVTSQPSRNNNNNNFPSLHLGFNPLTPPSSEPMMSPKNTMKPEDTTLTPHTSPIPKDPQCTTSSTPSTSTIDEGEKCHDDPLRRLQMTFEKNAFLPTTASALSPKTASEHSGGDDDELIGEEGVRQPAVNSHGKVKTFKCKQCDFVAITKMDFWAHSKEHIKSDKILTCPKCPFVTEYKHHLEYHLRNHFGSKPFKCDKCSYSCVNKSMLNSHMKSHSNVYQYRCQNCSYATKYCHSLKLHLRKYRHQPAMVLNPDGTPNPLPIIDVYGTRRGPKQRVHVKHEGAGQQPSPQQQQQHHRQQHSPSLPTNNNNNNNKKVSMVPPPPASKSPPAMEHPFAQFMNFASQGGQLPFPYTFFPGALGNPLLLAQQLVAQNAAAAANCADDGASEKSMLHSPAPYIQSDDESLNMDVENSGALDLSKPEAPKSRRKGKAFKLERPTLLDEFDKKAAEKEPEEQHQEAIVDVKPSSIATSADCTCKFCGIAFGDVILYTMHMGYHGYKDPFTCNMCGEGCNDKVAFFLHIARNPHT